MKLKWTLLLIPFAVACGEKEDDASDTSNVDQDQTDSIVTPASLEIDTTTKEFLWLITPEGIGPFKLDDKLAASETNDYTCAEFVPDHDFGNIVMPSTYTVINGTDTIIWMQDFYKEDKMEELTGTIAKMATPSKTPRTASGIGVGSTISEVMEAYPNHKVVTDLHAMGFSIIPDGTNLRFGFSFDYYDIAPEDAMGSHDEEVEASGVDPNGIISLVQLTIDYSE